MHFFCFSEDMILYRILVETHDQRRTIVRLNCSPLILLSSYPFYNVGQTIHAIS